MSDVDDIRLEPFEETQTFQGVLFPEGPRYRQFIITGPPGSGKSTMMTRLQGWPLEGFVDLTQPGWWRSDVFTFRPREINFGLPYKGRDKALAVFDQEWLNASPPLELDLERIVLPPEKNGALSRDWRHTYIFEFLLPDAKKSFKWRVARLENSLYPADTNLTLEQVERQNADYLKTAAWFCQSGLSAYVREENNKPPLKIIINGKKRQLLPVGKGPVQRIGTAIKRVLASPVFARRARRIRPGTAWQSFSDEIRLSDVDKPVRLRHGDQELVLQRGTMIYPGQRKPRQRDWLVVPSDYGQGTIRGFIRLKPGESAVLGPSGKNAGRLLGVPEGRHWPDLHVANAGGSLRLTPFDEDGTYALAADATKTAGIMAPHARLQRLKDVLEIFGGPIERLAPPEALKLARTIRGLLANEAYRPLNSEGKPGAILEIPERLTPIIIGDIHANVDNLLRLLCTNSYLDALEKDEACLIFLGDLVHEEAKGALGDMDGSMLMLDLVFRLKVHFPRNVFVLRGNHENFSPEVTKAGVPQGLLLEAAMTETRGPLYTAQMEALFSELPYIAKSKDFIACHAAPTRSQHSYETLIDLARYPGIAHEITWNRMKRPGFPSGYIKGDVKRFRKSLDVAKKTTFIVGHTPYGSEGACWTDIGKIKNHHIAYSARTDWIGLFTRINGKIVPLEHRAENLLAPLNQSAKDEADAETSSPSAAD